MGTLMKAPPSLKVTCVAPTSMKFKKKLSYLNHEGSHGKIIQFKVQTNPNQCQKAPQPKCAATPKSSCDAVQVAPVAKKPSCHHEDGAQCPSLSLPKVDFNLKCGKKKPQSLKSLACRCKRFGIPYLTLIAAIICIIGLITVLVSDIQVGSVLNELNLVILRERTVSIGIPITTDIVLCLITLAVVLVALIAAFLGPKGCTKNKWKRALTGRQCCLTLLILAIILFLVWLFKVCSASYYYALHESDKQSCRDYFGVSKSLRSAMCVTLSFVGSQQRRRICDGTTVNEFCVSFANKIIPIQMTQAIGSAVVVFGLMLLISSLFLNYKLLDLLKKVSLPGQTRY